MVVGNRSVYVALILWLSVVELRSIRYHQLGMAFDICSTVLDINLHELV